MVAAFNDMQKVWRLHVCAYTLEEIQRAKRIARALHKQDRRGQSAQNFIAEFCSIAHRAKRIPKTNESVHFFLQRGVTSNTSAHAFADQDCRGTAVFLAYLGQCLPMRGDELRQWVGAFPVLSHIGIIERLDVANFFQMRLPTLHPRMR